MSLAVQLLLVAGSFFSDHAEEAARAQTFFDTHTEIVPTLRQYLSDDQARMALAVVAPEVCVYSSLSDWAETRTLTILYVQQGRGDFSIGPFQMKPSFVERLEREVRSDARLQPLFSDLLIPTQQGSPEQQLRSERCRRLERMQSLHWQLRYLSLFITLAERRTSQLPSGFSEAKLLYWATLYNAGLDCDDDRIKRLQQVKSFPRRSRDYNYASVALEFYYSSYSNK